MARSYRDLLVWQKAKTLAVRIYQETEQFPRSESYGLTSQRRRAAVSVASNIAEWQGGLTTGEFRHFLEQALSWPLPVIWGISATTHGGKSSTNRIRCWASRIACLIR